MTSFHVSSRGRGGDNELDEALSEIDMESWLDAEGIDYKITRGSSGVQINLKECPKCGHDKWKVYCNAESGLGKCFVCDQGLNKWSMIRGYLPRLNSRDLVGHIKDFAKSQGWRAKRVTSVAVNTDTELKLPESIALPHNGRNLRYLDMRGITGEYAKYFELRISQVGKFFYKDDDKWKVQSYEKRVIIPVFDLNGDLVSFQGRDITGLSDRKYLFPPGFVATGVHLFNGQNAKGASRIAIGEGVFDCFAIKIAIDGEMALRDIVPVASFGKHISHGDETSQMAKLMELRDNGLKEVIFVWDSEPKAIHAAVDTALRCRSHGLPARVAILPPGCDPNEIPADVLRQCIWQAVPINNITAVTLKMKHAIK